MENESWIQDLKSHVVAKIQPKLDDWATIVNSFGLNENQRKHWVSQLVEATEGHFQAFINETLEEREKVASDIRELLITGKKLCQQLVIPFPNIDSTKCLYDDKKLLSKHIINWKDMITTRKLAIEKIQQRLDAICTTLGRPMVHLTVDPLLSEVELNKFMSMCNDMESEKMARVGVVQELRLEICTIVNELGYKPKLESEMAIINLQGNIDDFLSDKSLDRVSQMHRDIFAIKVRMTDDLSKYREQVERIWIDLEMDVQYTNDFVKTHCDVNCRTLEAFAAELARCGELRRANLRKFIDKLRMELRQLWDEGGFSAAQREEFRDRMEDTFYSEDLLTLHDLQINDVKKYIVENKHIFELLKKHEQMYAQRKELEVKANGPNRFKNRGGTLLNEEKQRNNLAKSIPSTEAALLKLAEKYEAKHGSPFYYNAQTIASIIGNARQTYEQEKKLLLSARKQKRDITMSGTKISQKSRLLTPTPNKSAKRTPKTAPTLNIGRHRRSLSKAKTRLSFNKKTPRKCTPAKVLKHLQNADSDREYVAFEHALSERSDSRSTIYCNDAPNSSQLNPIIRIDTPNTVERQLRLNPTKLDFIF